MNVFLFLWLSGGAWQSGATDSLAVLKSAQRARDGFEITRRANLPERPSGSSGGRYEIIGRLRYWYESGADEDSAREEPPRIRQARARLLSPLWDAAPALPRHDRRAGPPVRY